MATLRKFDLFLSYIRNTEKGGVVYSTEKKECCTKIVRRELDKNRGTYPCSSLVESAFMKRKARR